MRSLAIALPILILTATLVLAPPIRAATGATVVYPNGVASFTVPASQYLNVFTTGSSSARVEKQVGYANFPTAWALETNGVVSNQEVTFGPYTTATVIRIKAGTDRVFYSVGALAAVIPCLNAGPALVVHGQLAPVAQTTTVTLLANDLMSGIVTATQSSGATVAYTLPTGTLTDAASNLQINEGFEWSIINLSTGANTITLTAGSGHTIVGNAIVGVASSSVSGSARWYTRKTAANTFVTYRL
jgi:hypothetical protein